MTNITFNCATCNDEVTEPWNLEIAEAEFRRDFPDQIFDLKKLVHVCESCYKQITEWKGNREPTLQ